MSGELIGEPADLAPTHRVWLPVNDSGPIPGRPIRPAARWQLMIALTLSVPADDWFTPCEYTVTVRSVLANQS